MKIIPLSSGSSGNALYIEGAGARFLVDAGLNKKRLTALMAEADRDPRLLDGIFITHEHIDHTAGLGVVTRGYHIPVYITEKSFVHLPKSLGVIPPELIRIIRADRPMLVRGVEVLPFTLFHDSAECVGYRFKDPSGCIAVLADTGCVNERIIEDLSEAEILLMESDYDVDMLLSGPYPYDLKMRILSQRGHLSNDDAGAVAVKLAGCGVRRFILSHLSAENNSPDIAEITVRSALREAGCPDSSFELAVARREAVTGIFDTKEKKF